MAPVKYVYDYPEQRELAKYLVSEDKQWLADNTEFSKSTIKAMCCGSRKMPDNFKQLVKQIGQINIKAKKQKETLKLKFVA